MDEAAKIIDNNLQSVRWVVIGIGIAGVTVLARTVRLATRFTTVSSIPDKFFRGQVALHGKVRDVKSNGVLMVEHIPIVNFPSKPAENSLLAVRLAAVNQRTGSIDWLRKNVLEKAVFFRLLAREGDFIWSDVRYQKWLLPSKNVNISLIKSGLAEPEAQPVLLGIQAYEDLFERARKVDKSAKQKSVWNFLKKFWKRK